MINLALRSEYSFKKVLGRTSEILKFNNGEEHIGIADHNNTFSHIYLQRYCDANNLKPIFGVRLEVIADEYLRVRGKFGPVYIFIAKNNSGLQELNELVATAWSKFYYKPMIAQSDLFAISDDVIVIAETVETLERLDYIALTPSTPMLMLDIDKPKVFIQKNFYPTALDKPTYELFCGAQKRGDGWQFKFETQTYPQHILSESEFSRLYPGTFIPVENTREIAKQCTARLLKAPMVKYIGKEVFEVECYKGAKKLGIDLSTDEYGDRLERELSMIKEKDYVDYFLIVSDLIKYAKKNMFVGPGRGSSAGSLVCYLLGITTVDPIKHGLLFERFIDITREDLPDIDIDFPDVGRDKVIKYLFKKYGSDNVCHISNINRLKAKSAIDEFGKGLMIPKFEVDQLKDAIVDRTGGDARAKMAIEDTLNTTDIGKEFLENYPAMKLVEYVQDHAAHAGKHAAGVIVCSEVISKYGAINTRENSVMMDKGGTDDVNLLKIDCLGLRTLSILQDAAIASGHNPNFFYDLPLDDGKAIQIFKDMRLYGIFQFEGQAMNMLCSKMGVDDFEDIVNITALARPGPLHSGGADKFIKRRTGAEPVDYGTDNEDFKRITYDTYGVIVFQEQLMNICKDVGDLSWPDVSKIRKAISKTLGKHFFKDYKAKFIEGAGRNGLTLEQSNQVWETMISFGAWAMNKSHSVSYGLISYWCAYMKAHYPLEFTMANLNHSKSKESSIRILRDASENEGIEYIPVDVETSDINWSVVNGKLLGGLVNIKGVAEKTAKTMIQARQNKTNWTPSMVKHLLNPVTDYDELYPCDALWGILYHDYQKVGLTSAASYMKDINDVGEYTVVGKLIKKDLRDLNEYNEIVKRKGKRLNEFSMFLKLILEDDTGTLYCSINRYKFEELKGRHYAETGIEDETWYLLKGRIRSADWRILDIDLIYDLTEDPNGVFKK